MFLTCVPRKHSDENFKSSEGKAPGLIHPSDQNSDGRYHLVGNCKAPSHKDLDDQVENLAEMVDALQPLKPRIILIPPFPRFFDACCTNNRHFHSDFNGPQFNTDLRDFSHFLSSTSKFNYACGYSGVAISLEKALGPGVWKGDVTSHDMVHVNPSALQTVADYIESIHLEVVDDVLNNLEDLAVPEEVSFSSWVVRYREINGLQPVAPPKSFDRLELGVDCPPPRKAMRGKNNKFWKR